MEELTASAWRSRFNRYSTSSAFLAVEPTLNARTIPTINTVTTAVHVQRCRDSGSIEPALSPKPQRTASLRSVPLVSRPGWGTSGSLVRVRGPMSYMDQALVAIMSCPLGSKSSLLPDRRSGEERFPWSAAGGTSGVCSMYHQIPHIRSISRYIQDRSSQNLYRPCFTSP